MDIKARKLRLIEDFIKIQDNTLLDRIEALISSKQTKSKELSIEKFSGIWPKEEANEINKIIEEGCGLVNEADW